MLFEIHMNKTKYFIEHKGSVSFFLCTMWKTIKNRIGHFMEKSSWFPELYSLLSFVLCSIVFRWSTRLQNEYRKPEGKKSEGDVNFLFAG